MNIRDLLKKDEGKTLEFKRDLSSPQQIIKTLVAFANTAGGLLIIGVDDKTRQPVGVEKPLDEEERLCNLIADSISPRLVPNVEMTTIDGKTLLLVETFLSGLRPHWLKVEGPENGVYVRLGSTNRKADRQLIAELRRSAEGIAYDEMSLPELSVNDLELEAINNTLGAQHRIDENGLRSLKLLVMEQGRLVPTRGAVLLFGKNRLEYFPDAWVQCGRFIGRDKAEIFDHIEFYDHLPNLVDSIMLFLKKHAMRGADFSEIRRKDVWSIPLSILREAVINALVHADYSQRGAPIRIAFFDDRIEIENPGILPPGITVEDMKAGVSRIRNPVIARVFRELGLIEQWGSGVPRMFKEAEELGLPGLQVEELGMRVRLTVMLKEALAPEVTEQVTPQVAPQVTPQVISLLRVLEGEMSREALQSLLALKDRKSFRERYLLPALQEGLIEMTIPEKPRSSTQKYRLTEKGRQALKMAEGKKREV